jgi:hypothetical protein
MDNYIYILFIIVFFIFFIFLLFENVVLSQILINPNECNKIFGSFGVKPNSAYVISSDELATISKCNPNGNSLCKMENVSSLQDAINYCNNYSSFCNAFVYSALDSTMFIVDSSQTLSQNYNYDLYQRQDKILIY